MNPINGKELFVAIDGNALVHRAFHAFPPTLGTSSGTQTNAVYGFSTMLLQMLSQFKPNYVVCAFDTGKKTFRHAKFADYKAHRKPVDASLISQFPLVEEVLKAFNIPIVKRDGFEADDILGTLAKWVNEGKWSKQNLELLILTGDRDLLQVIGKNVNVCIPDGSFKNMAVYNRENAFKKYGYYPEQVTDYKAIVGDQSDNIPGVAGVGDKTTLELLAKYGSLEEIYKHLAEVPSRYANKLKEGVEQAYFSKDLATISTDMDLDLKVQECLLRDFNSQELIKVFTQFEFRSLITRLPQSINIEQQGDQLDMFSNPQVKESAEVIELEKISEGSLKKVLKIESKVYVIFLSNDEFENQEEGVVMIVDNSGELRIYYSSLDSIDGKCFTTIQNHETYFWNYEDLVSRKDVRTTVKNAVDIRLLACHLSSGKKSYSLSSMFFDYLSLSYPEKFSKNNLSQLVAFPKLCQEIVLKAGQLKLSDYVHSWIEAFFKELNISNTKDGKEYKNEGGEIIDVIKYIEMPVADAIARMENKGIMISNPTIKALKDLLVKDIEKIKKDIFESIGHEFNLNSPKQLSDVLYRELQIPTVMNGKNKFSTREDILTELIPHHPSIENILKYRELSKLLATYVTPLKEIADKNEGVIRTDFRQAGASSGRFASINPNLQNIPIRGKWGTEVRKIFVAREGFRFVGADYSQIEFRVMADICEDANLIKEFSENIDIHKATASHVFKKDLKEITADERSMGKTINFAVLFGQTQYGLSRLMKIDQKVAKTYIEDYFKHYAGVARYIENSKEMAHKDGYVQSMLGRTRYISGVYSANRNIREAALREAINMPIQGGEADIVRLAMIKVDRLIQEKYKDKAFMLLQIHDELVFEVKEDKVEEFKKDVYELMKNVIQLKVPLDVNVSDGSNLAELK